MNRPHFCTAENCNGSFVDKRGLSTHFYDFHQPVHLLSATSSSVLVERGEDGFLRCPVEGCKASPAMQRSLRRHLRDNHMGRLNPPSIPTSDSPVHTLSPAIDTTTAPTPALRQSTGPALISLTSEPAIASISARAESPARAPIAVLSSGCHFRSDDPQERE